MENESKHTPGPWHNGIDERQIEAADGTIICTVSGSASNPMVLADCRIIAAAPELLETLRQTNEALKEIHKHARGMWNELVAAGYAEKKLKMPCHDRNLAAIDCAHAVIAKAEGRE